MTELLLGCGHSRQKRLGLPGQALEFSDLVTLDFNEDCKPDLVCNLNNTEWLVDSITEKGKESLINPHLLSNLKESFFSEVHAYEVLEHLGKQGDYESFFNTFDNIYRILENGGYLFATVPSRYSPWLWGDPGHTRAILPETLTFLDQRSYEQCGKTTMSDYRYIYKSDFDIIHTSDNKVFHQFVLQAVKPARIKSDCIHIDDIGF